MQRLYATGCWSPFVSTATSTWKRAGKQVPSGGGTAGGSNTIAFSGREGVQMDDDGVGAPNNTNGNTVSRNSISSNDRLGINLRGGVEGLFSGRTANDGDNPSTPEPDPDSDTGTNGLQNKPVLSSAKKSATDKTIVKGKLNSTPSNTFTVRFFSNPPGGEEGKKFLGQKKVSTDSSGNVSFTKALPKVAVGKTITATATDPGGNTSEFSAPRKVVAS